MERGNKEPLIPINWACRHHSMTFITKFTVMPWEYGVCVWEREREESHVVFRNSFIDFYIFPRFAWDFVSEPVFQKDMNVYQIFYPWPPAYPEKNWTFWNLGYTKHTLRMCVCVCVWRTVQNMDEWNDNGFLCVLLNHKEILWRSFTSWVNFIASSIVHKVTTSFITLRGHRKRKYLCVIRH